MKERYSRLFSLEKNLYATGAPVLIAAGALLKDNETDKILAQIKYKNISDKTIKSITVEVTMLDSADRFLSEKVSYTYLDLSMVRDSEIGQKEPIVLPNGNARAFKAMVCEVVFTDKTVWYNREEEWNALSEPESVAQKLKSNELAQQFTRDCGKPTRFVAKDYGDIWLCTCGALNMKSEASCHSCNLEFSEQTKKLNAAALSENLKEYKLNIAYEEAIRIFENGKATESAEKLQDAIKRFAEIKEYKESSKKIEECITLIEEIKLEKERQEQLDKEKSERIKKLVAIFIPAVCLVIAFVVVLNTVIIPNGKYNDAVKMINEGKYIEAFQILGDLHFKDSDTLLKDNMDNYKRAVLSNAKVGDVVYLGQYEQDGDINNGEEVIEWIVTKKENDKLLIQSKHILDYIKQEYSYIESRRNYEKNENRVNELEKFNSWLNKDFVDETFNSEEKTLIEKIYLSFELSLEDNKTTTKHADLKKSEIGYDFIEYSKIRNRFLEHVNLAMASGDISCYEKDGETIVEYFVGLAPTIWINVG